MMLGLDEIEQVKEIIKMLSYFKLVGEKLGKEKEVTISMIIPMFDFIRTKVINHNESDSIMVQDMKSHIRKKPNNRYTDKQKKFLTTIQRLLVSRSTCSILI